MLGKQTSWASYSNLPILVGSHPTIVKCSPVGAPSYLVAMDENEVFYKFQKANLPPSGRRDRDSLDYDWKFHFRIAPQDIERAWDLVADYLMQQGVGAIKIVAPTQAQSEEFKQSPIMLTLYDLKAANISAQQWKSVISDIERIWLQNNIESIGKIEADREVPGSKYCSYRCDITPDGRYIARYELQKHPLEHRYNPFNFPDPFLDFSITSQHRGAESVKDSAPIERKNEIR